ncbi:hypothetical protein CPU12_03690 [Malaciobacter molluscorum LMG 25693]|uniref:Uncharacterized protein n=1 Tax=Malaciobacter molluscorum LMG 25693 TaxID=870501 RepID=A0A2G1DJJ8_9BACT|nr:tetratricopeptide repeat protein [Malaciobacter molluscorum]AXX92839.1 hypothetical protein AMOL_1876 [Malaciobacter molluscorum LMG 25693]PHO18678.1 hypothetical protein CPU12_03690 [Malaciobacter molluscorum LMG 25693]RXJ96160.1 hypothetical protein CRV00_02970 [Malaciobacter molluscorum]
MISNDEESLQVDDYILKADKLITFERNYEEAIKYLEEALVINPTNYLTYSKIGYCFMQLEDFNNAVIFFKKAISFSKNDSTTYYNLAICLEELDYEDYDEIDQYYEKSIVCALASFEKNPSNHIYIKYIADAFFKLENYKKSINYYERFLKYQLDEEVLEFLGYSYLYQREDFNKAILNLKKAIKYIEENDKKIYLYKIIISIYYYDLKQYKEAIKIYHKIIEISEEKDYVQLYFNIADIYRKNLKDYEKAIEFYHKSLEYDDNFEPSYSWLACTHSYKKEYKLALKYFLIAKDLNPTSVEVYNNLVYIYSDLGVYDKVEENLLKALEIDPLYDASLLAMLEVNLVLGKEFDKKCVDTILQNYSEVESIMAEYNMLRILKQASLNKDIKEELKNWEDKYTQLRQGYSVEALKNWAKNSNLKNKQIILDALDIFKKEN